MKYEYELQTAVERVRRAEHTVRLRPADGVRLYDRLERAWLYVVTKTALAYFERFAAGEVHGAEHLAAVVDEGCVLALNHTSYLDWLVVWAVFRNRLGRDITFIGKDALFRSRVWGPLMKQAGVVRVADDGAGFLDKAGYRRLRHAGCIGIFPEGTRSPDGRLQPAKSGVIKLALRLKRPIVPVALEGFFEAWPRGAKLPRLRPDRCRILFGAPWTPSLTEKEEQGQLDDATAEVMGRIGALLGGNGRGS